MKPILTSYLASLKFRKATTRKTYEQGIKKYAAAVGINTPISLEAYIKFLKSLSDFPASTQRVYRAAVVDLYKFFCDEHNGNVNLLAMKRADQRYLKRETRKFHYARAEVEKIVAYAETLRGDLRNLRDRAFILLLVDSGLRNSEACALKRGDVPWNTGILYIIGKGDKEDKVRFSNRALAAIKDYLNARAKLDGETGVPLDSLPLFARHDRGAGKRIKVVHPGGMWWSFSQHMKAAGVEPRTISPHKLRHEAVTRYYENTRDIKKTKEFSRHARMDTVDRYTHLIDNEVDESYQEIFNK